jgi:hypothetical protein
VKPDFKPLILALAVTAALGGIPAASFAQTDTLEQSAAAVERTASTAPRRAAEQMAKEFAELAGSEENALKLIEGLRQGNPVRLDDDPQATTISPSSGTGYGNVFITLALSQAALTQSGNTAPTSEQLSSTISGVLEKRGSGMGWGQIAKDLDLNLGKVISSIKSGKDRLETSLKAKDGREKGSVARTDHAPRTAKPERPDRPTRPDKPERGPRP